jgi:KDO2-lipid IV(A) lauroyltransferase
MMAMKEQGGLVEWLHQVEVAWLDRLARAAAAWDAGRRRRVGRLVAWLARDVLRVRWRHTVEALQRHLGLDAAAAMALGRRVYDTFFENAVEQASLAYLTGEELDARIRPTGLEHLQRAHARGRGVIIVSGHYGLWELVPPWLCRHGFRMTVVVRRQNNRAVDAWMEKMRRRDGVETTDSGYSLREILRALRQGHLLGLMSDQDAGTRGIFVRFFGEEASTVVGPATIALKTGAPVVCLVLHPGRPHPPHHLEIAPPIFPEEFPDTDAGRQALTQVFTNRLEAWIRARPEQWFWLHRRWKTRPVRKASDS